MNTVRRHPRMAHSRKVLLDCALILSFLISPAHAETSSAAIAQTLMLKKVGPPRVLQGPVFGASTTAFYEHLLNNPAKINTLGSMAIGLDRFPGGSDANFYNWRTGLFDIQVSPDSSAYMRFWSKAAANIARGHPNGITLEQYESFSRQIGAEVILVPNLETSSVAEQVEWFRRLAGKGAVPQRIELGNEFWVAMGNDPASLKRWPDARSTMRTMKQYVDALKPYFPANAKVAIQAASGAINIPENGRAPFWRRLRQWDEDLRPEPWFDAVTLHLYPRLGGIMGNPQAGTTPPTRENALPRLKAMMADGDEGVERIIQDTERRLPGKEIWITEWNSRGANTVTTRSGASEPLSPAMSMLVATRMALVYLRHPAVTAALYFDFGFSSENPASLFVARGDNAYAPLPTAAALRWLNEAANAGGSFQRLVQDGAKPVAGGGARPQSYLSVEGGLFQSKDRTVLILENPSSDAFSLNPTALVPNRPSSTIEFMSMPDLADTARLPAKIERQDAAATIAIAPFSVTRVVWEQALTTKPH